MKADASIGEWSQVYLVSSSFCLQVEKCSCTLWCSVLRYGVTLFFNCFRQWHARIDSILRGMLKSVTSTPQVITYLVYSNCLVSIRYLFRRLIFVTFDAVILKLRVWPHVYLEHYSALKFLVSILIMGKALGNFTCRRFLMSYQITYSNHGFKKSLKKFIT